VQVEALLERTADRLPEKVALICGERRLRYSDIEREANKIANGLIATGVQRGDRVAVHLENSVEAVLSVFAIAKAGAVFMMVSPSAKVQKLVYLLNDSGAKALITESHKAAGVLSDVEPMPELKTILAVGTRTPPVRTHRIDLVGWDELLEDQGRRGQPPPKQCIDIDMAALLYTSGSTGSPKGVVVTHLNMVTTARSIATYLENKSSDSVLNVLPLSFGYGLYQVLTVFMTGGTVVLERSFAYPHAVLQRLIEERVTGFPMVPTMFAILLQTDMTEYRFPHLRYITNAGAALPVHHITKLAELFPTARFYSMYGLTECQRVSYLPPDQLSRRPSSVGKAMPNLEVWIANECGQRVSPGETGELVVRGSSVMKGYWKRPEETMKVLRPSGLPGDHVLHTGDLFRMDDEGYLFWIGRKDDIIKCRGEKVSPKEVENVLYKLDAVAMAAVVGVPDDISGQAVKAVIKVRDGMRLTENEVLRHCSKHLEDFMVPAIVEFREDIPMTASGKIDRRELARA
jgi:long-chain acyl-CoA synthetase